MHLGLSKNIMKKMRRSQIFYETNPLDTHFQFSIKTLNSKCAVGKTYQTKCAAGQNF